VASGGSSVASIGIVHVHSAFSHDGRDSIDDLVQLARERGINAICLADHAEDFDAAIFDRYVESCERASSGEVVVFPGLEYRFAGYAGLHLLAFGQKEWMTPNTPEEFVEEAPRVCGLTVLAHPILAGYRIPPAVAASIDAVEVWNARYNTRYLPDPRAIDVLRELRGSRPCVVALAGLDQHDGRNDRETRVVTSGAAQGLLADLRAGRFTNRGRHLSFGATASYSAAGLLSLRVGRALLDTINRAHDKWASHRRARASR
jgi:hypothetical protein